MLKTPVRWITSLVKFCLLTLSAMRVGVFGQLGNGVDDAAAVAAVLTGGQHIQAVAEVEKSGGIKRPWSFLL